MLYHAAVGRAIADKVNEEELNDVSENASRAGPRKRKIINDISLAQFTNGHLTRIRICGSNNVKCNPFLFPFLFLVLFPFLFFSYFVSYYNRLD